MAKQFTGYLIQRLVDRATLELDARVDASLPELVTCPAGTATVRQLLHMTSGLPDTVGLKTTLELQLHREQWMNDDELLRRICKLPLAFPPGTGFLYSNVGYRLLAMIASRVTHTPWPKLLRHEVFDAAGMKNADVFEPAVAAPSDLLAGHLPFRCYLLAGRSCMMRLPHWNYAALWGAGAVHLEASDLWAWGRFLKRLSTDDPDFFARYTQPDREDYAAGIGSATLKTRDGDEIRVHSHSGEDPGYVAYFAWISTTDTTLVMISNTDYSYNTNYSLGSELKALLAGQSYRVVN